jgi:hypothetical protein
MNAQSVTIEVPKNLSESKKTRFGNTGLGYIIIGAILIVAGVCLIVKSKSIVAYLQRKL